MSQIPRSSPGLFQFPNALSFRRCLSVHLRDPRTLCIVCPFEISNLPPHCVAHRKEEKQQQPYSGDSSVYGCSPQKRKKNNNHTLKIHHCMVVFLLFCGLHNEAGDSKFRNRRQYIAYVGHVGVLSSLIFSYLKIGSYIL